MSSCGPENPTVANFDIIVNQYSTFEYPFQLLDSGSNTPTNITGWSFSGSIKRMFRDANPLMYFTCSITSPSESIITMKLSPNQTALLTGSKYVFDLIANDTTQTPDEVVRLAQGKVIVYLGSTVPTLTD